jgi:hypothetical protein
MFLQELKDIDHLPIHSQGATHFFSRFRSTESLSLFTDFSEHSQNLLFRQTLP